MVIKVFLRQKPIRGNRLSLYLDFYPPIEKNGKKTRREFLNLFLYGETEFQEQLYTDDNGTKQKRLVPVLNGNHKPKKINLEPIYKQHNKEILQLAEQIRQKRDKQLNGNQALTELEKNMLEKDARERVRGEQNFVEYFKRLADKRKKSNHDNWQAAYNYLESFTNGNLRFADLNESFCDDFREYLLNAKSVKSDKTTLSQNSALSYFNKFRAALKQAYKDGFLNTDINAKIKTIEPAETRRNFLTLDELNKLAKTPCNNQLLKRAALFSALTGLRFSDIQKLNWKEIELIEGQYYINFIQQKTKKVETLPISEQAYTMLGEPGTPDSRPFEGLTYSAYENKHLYQWIGAAGITKEVTFHSFRHTFAVLQLDKGTEIYTVSKMLGHRDLKTTQIYAKILDKAKREAANRIKLDL